MKEDIAGLVERLDDGICDDWCKVRDAKSGCTCAEIASTIRAQVAEIEQWRVDFNECYADLKETIAKLREAVEVLAEVRDAIINADPNVLTCTLWMPLSPAETVVDRIDAFLATMEKQDG